MTWRSAGPSPPAFAGAGSNPLPQGEGTGVGCPRSADYQSASAVTSVAMLARSQAEAAQSCNQSPPDSTPEISMLLIQQTLAAVCPSHVRLRALASRPRHAADAAADAAADGAAGATAPLSFVFSMRTLGRSRRGRRGTCPTCGTLRALPRAGPGTSQSPWRRRQSVVDT